MAKNWRSILVAILQIVSRDLTDVPSARQPSLAQCSAHLLSFAPLATVNTDTVAGHPSLNVVCVNIMSGRNPKLS